MTETAAYEVKPPSAVLAEDVICQSFIQSSSTLAYACLLIRRGRHDLAAHVLHSLEAKPASRFKDMVFYLQVQIGIETGDFAAVKRRLVPRVHQHPNDMVALSLLASCVHLEWEDWLRRNPALAAANPFRSRRSRRGPGSRGIRDPGAGTRGHPPVPYAGRAHCTLGPRRLPVRPGPSGGRRRRPGSSPRFPPIGAGAPSRPCRPPATRTSASTRAWSRIRTPTGCALWNSSQRTHRSVCRKPALESLVSILPHTLPAGLAAAVRALEGGEIHKACFSFQALTVTSLHAGAESLGLVTGNMNQSLLTMVRAENIFLKGSGAAAARVGAA